MQRPQQIIPPSNSLVRYHSAPSSTLTSLLVGNSDIIEELVDILTAPEPAIEDTEFAKFLDDHLISIPNDCMSSLELDTPLITPASPAPVAGCDSHLPSLESRACSATDHALNVRPQLYTVQETHIGSSATDCTSGSHLPSPFEHGIVERQNTALHRGIPLTESSYSSCSVIRMDQRKTSPISNLIRHNSSPAHVLSSLADENSLLFNDGPALQQQTLAHELSRSRTDIEITSITQSVRTAHVHPLVERQSGFLHDQSGSPSGIITHLSSGVMSPSTSCSTNSVSRKVLLKDKDGGGAHQTVEDLSWPEEFGFARPKRGRDIWDMDMAQSSDSTVKNREAVYHAKADLTKLRSTEVLCRVSAKRGYATHPRSIAERMRKAKINEGIKKLQELMPNCMEKQMNTVTMLDEAVEYVKFLQRQVQELSIPSRPGCSGMCHSRYNKYA